MNADGSYSILEDGRSVSLEPGRRTAVGDGDNVTLNADGSLSLVKSSADGGSISTTLRSTGQGVDVNVTATGVDLAGYLVEKAA